MMSGLHICNSCCTQALPQVHLLQAEDVDKASARLEAADDDRAAVLSRLQVVHQQKARQLSENVAAVQQVKHVTGCRMYLQ